MKKKFLVLILAISMIPAPILSYANDSNNETIVTKSAVNKKEMEENGSNIVEDNIDELKEVLNFYNKDLNFFKSFKSNLYILNAVLLCLFSIYLFYGHREVIELGDMAKKVVEQENNRRNFFNQNFGGK